MTLDLRSKEGKSRNRLFPGLLRAFTLTLLIAAFSLTSLHAQTVAYVTNSNSNTVSVVDVSTNTVIATIPVGGNPLGVALTPDNTHAYVGNFFAGTVSVIDTASNTVITTITVGGQPAYPAVTPDGKSVYMPTGGSVVVIDTASNSIVASIAVSGLAQAAVITPDGAHAYVSGHNKISVIDTATNTVVTSVAVTSNGGPFAFPVLAITPAGDSVYVAGANNSVVQVISTASNSVVATIPTPQFGDQSVAVTPDGSKVYIAEASNSGSGGAVGIIDTATNTLEPTAIPVGSLPIPVAVTPDNAFVYVGIGSDSRVSVISTATNTLVTNVAVGKSPAGIAITSLGHTQPPTAVAGPNQTVQLGQTVNLNGLSSFAPNTLPANLQYAWSFVSQPIGSTAVLSGANTATPSFVPEVPGNFVVQLIVTDPATSLSSSPSQLTVSSIWSPPTANPGPAQAAVTGVVVNLNGSGSTDPNGLPLISYTWSLVAKPAGSTAAITSSGSTASFTPDVVGSYTVGLVVSDAFGSSPQATTVISATTPGALAEGFIQQAINYIAAMPASNFDASGHRNSLTNFLQQALSDIQAGKTSQAIGKLNNSIIRTDGFPLRGAIDGNGPGMDWIINDTDQTAVYGDLTNALNALNLP